MQHRRTDIRAGTPGPSPAVTPEQNTAYPDTVQAQATPRWHGRSYDAFSWVALLGGLWVAISPWVLNFAALSPRLTVNDLVIGLAAAFIAMGAMTAVRGVTGSGLANVVLGGWIIVTAFVLFPTPPGPGFAISQIVGGAVVLVFALAGQLASHQGSR